MGSTSPAKCPLSCANAVRRCDSTANSSIIRRVMPKRLATISAVEPMESFTMGSVRPRRIAITGAR